MFWIEANVLALCRDRVSQLLAQRYRYECVELTDGIGGTADMKGLVAAVNHDENDPKETFHPLSISPLPM